MTAQNLQEKLERLVSVGISLSSIRDLDTLLERILDEAMELSRADAASLYLVRGQSIEFHICRNQSLEQRLGTRAAQALYQKAVMPLSASSMAGYCALTGETLNFADVLALPEDLPYHYNASFDQRTNYQTRSMLVVPMKDREGHCVGVIQLINALSPDWHEPVPFDAMAETLARGFASQAGVALVNALLDAELKKAHLETLFRLSTAAEYRDKETSNHIKRMSRFSRIIAREVGLSRDDIDMITWSSPMHDVGKIGIPDHILQKPGRLEPEERAVMEAHAIIGAHILKDSEVPVLRQAAVVALTHHEKFDGTGYPRRLSGEAIPLVGRIVALADVFDALSSRRCYKEPWPEDKVIEFLRQERGRHFDPLMVDVFLNQLPEIRELQRVYEDTDEDLAKFTDFSRLEVPEV